MKRLIPLLFVFLCSILLIGSCSTTQAKRERSLVLQAEALSLLDAKEFERALPLLQEAVNLVPNESEGRYNLVLALLATQRFDEAITLSRSSFSLFPAHMEFLLAQAYALREKGDTDDAFSLYRDILALDRGNFSLHADLMELALEQGQSDFAKQVGQYLLSVHKEEARAFKALATIEGDASWYALASTLMKGASEEDPEQLPGQSK